MAKALAAIILSVLTVPAIGTRAQQGTAAVQARVADTARNNRRATGMMERTIAVADYAQRPGVVNVEMSGTSLLPDAGGSVRIQPRQSEMAIEAEFRNLEPAGHFGPEYLTYILWAISAEGRATNLGELAMNGAEGRLNATTDATAFGLILTVEPYFAVSIPSEFVVMENIFKRGPAQFAEASYRTLPRNAYTKNISRSKVKPIVIDAGTPLDLYEARNAVWIALWAGADESPAGFFDKAERSLQRAEAFHASGAGAAVVRRAAREAVQTAENARALAVHRSSTDAAARSSRS